LERQIRMVQLQSASGLLGEIDYEKTQKGIIICKDGFSATTINEEQFKNLTLGIGIILK